jgi:hypothetical protein
MKQLLIQGSIWCFIVIACQISMLLEPFKTQGLQTLLILNHTKPTLIWFIPKFFDQLLLVATLFQQINRSQAGAQVSRGSPSSGEFKLRRTENHGSGESLEIVISGLMWLFNVVDMLIYLVKVC